MVCGVAERNGALFLAKRGPGGPHAGLWEFPGGKVEPGETDAEALHRELLEELGCSVTIGPALGQAKDERIELHALAIQFVDAPRGLEAEAIGWHSTDALGALSMPPCDRQILEHLKVNQKRL